MPTITELVERYLSYRPDLAESTEATIRSAAERFRSFMSDRDADSVLTDDVLRFRAELIHSGLTEATVRKYARHLGALWRLGARAGIVRGSPWIAVPSSVPRPAHPPHYVSLDDLNRVLAACPDESWSIMFALCRLAGLRFGEARSLPASCVDMNRRHIRVHGIKTRRWRDVPICPQLASILEARRGSDDTVSGFRHSDVFRMSRKIIENAGLVPWSKPFHSLRKSCESDWLRVCPVHDVAAWMGHSPSIALTFYHTPLTSDRITGMAGAGGTGVPTCPPIRAA